MRNDKPIGIVELSRKLGLPKGWLREQAVADAIPCLRVGKLLRFNVDAVRAAIADMAKKPSGDKKMRRAILGDRDA